MTVAKSLSVLELRAAERPAEFRSAPDRIPAAYVITMCAVHVAIWATAGSWAAVASTVPLTIAIFFVAPIHHLAAARVSSRSIRWSTRPSSPFGHDRMLTLEERLAEYRLGRSPSAASWPRVFTNLAHANHGARRRSP